MSYKPRITSYKLHVLTLTRQTYNVHYSTGDRHWSAMQRNSCWNIWCYTKNYCVTRGAGGCTTTHQGQPLQTCVMTLNTSWKTKQVDYESCRSWGTWACCASWLVMPLSHSLRQNQRFLKTQWSPSIISGSFQLGNDRCSGFSCVATCVERKVCVLYFIFL